MQLGENSGVRVACRWPARLPNTVKLIRDSKKHEHYGAAHQPRREPAYEGIGFRLTLFCHWVRIIPIRQEYPVSGNVTSHRHDINSNGHQHVAGGA
jgi:hypothetical protein